MREDIGNLECIFINYLVPRLEFEWWDLTDVVILAIATQLYYFLNI